jgi:hypothetical protein
MNHNRPQEVGKIREEVRKMEIKPVQSEASRSFEGHGRQFHSAVIHKR